MGINEIQELLKLINKLKFSEFKMKDGEFEITVRSKEYSKARQQVAAAHSATPSIIPVPAPVTTVQAAPAMPAPIAPQVPATVDVPPAAAPTAPSEAPTGNYKEVRSPIVGTFYRSVSPEKPPFIKVGDTIKEGQVVCIVEAMKLFNEIESEVSGKVVKMLVEDAQPVEYDQVLFLVEA